jgi:hypothetical protein
MKTSRVIRPDQTITFRYKFTSEFEAGPLGFGMICEFYDEDELK